MRTLLEVSGLKKYFPVERGLLKRCVGQKKAVDDVSFSIHEQEVLGLVGESGSGKSTAARLIMRLIEPTEGKISFLGQDFLALKPKELKQARCSMQMVFQDPLGSLNVRKTVLDNIGEALLVHKRVKNKAQMQEKVAQMVAKVGLSTAILNHYPHQFSGGQQQRISLARALILDPKLLICDEITSALDLSIQAQVLNLLLDLKKNLKLGFLIISHDLAVIQHLCDRVIVMRSGTIVESGRPETIFSWPKHPYTQKLLDSLPVSHPKYRQSRQSTKFILN